MGETAILNRFFLPQYSDFLSALFIRCADAFSASNGCQKSEIMEWYRVCQGRAPEPGGLI